MIAAEHQDCPRCEEGIHPGEQIVPTPRGWTHASCMPGGDDE